MIRSTLLIILLIAVVVCPSVWGNSATTRLLVDRPPESLRGQEIDLDDGWNAARLLAHFGETRLAYEALRQRQTGGATDSQVERFEARLLAESGLFARADSLLALQTFTPDPENYYVHYLRRARLNLLAGDPARALRFISVIDSLPSAIYAPYKDYVALEAFLALEDYGAAAEVGTERLAAGIPVSLSPRFEAHVLDAYFGAGDLESAHGFIRLLKKRHSRSSELAPVLAREVELLFALGDTTAAVESAFDIATNKNTRRYAMAVVEQVALTLPATTLSNEVLLEFCKTALGKNKLRIADELMTELTTRELDGGDEERRSVYRADLLYKEKRYSKAYRLIEDRFEDAGLERRAALLRARIFRKTGQPVRAADAYVEFAARFPYDAIAPEALSVAADLYLRSDDRKRSLATLERVINTYPSNRHARVATMRMSIYYIERSHYSRAADILERAVDRTNRRNTEFLYYLADTYRRMGKIERSRQILDEIAEIQPVSFYLAPEIVPTGRRPIINGNGTIDLYSSLGLLPFLSGVFRAREAAYTRVREELGPLDTDNASLISNAVYLQRGRQFLQIGFRDWAEFELRVVEKEKRIPARARFELGVLYDDFAMHWRSVRAFQTVYYAVDRDARNALEREFKLLMYPVPFPAVVFENCARYGIAPHLVYGMMRQESLFETNAVSRSGAQGLMQLMPATGEEVASRLGMPRSTEVNLMAPETNLHFGIWYAAHLLARADENPLMMLSAYNAGLGNARRWFSQTSDAAARVAMVDGIDYRETRNYVKRIVEHSHVYHAFYFDPSRATDSTH